MKTKASSLHMPRIYHVVPAFPPALGGMEKVVQILASIQTENGLNVSVITSDQRISGPIPVDEFTVMRLKSWLIANTTIMPSLFAILMKIKRSSLVHVHITQAYTPEVVWFASKFKRYSYIAHIHLDVPPSGPAGFLLKIYKPLVLKRVLNAAKFVVVFTNDQKVDVNKRYGVDLSKIKVIPNGVEDKFYFDKSRTLHKKPRLLYVGRLGYQKNIPQLLNALSGVSDQFETTLVGDGELDAELKGLAKQLKLENVSFAGRKDGEALLRYFIKHDVFVLSSEREGMPLVLLEAMAMALPIVATNVTGNRDVIKDGKNGLLVPYDDADAFQKALLKIKSEAKSYKTMSETARKMADQYSWGKIVAIFEGLYAEATK